MPKRHINYGAKELNSKASPPEVNKSVQKLPDAKRQTLYQELKSSGSTDNPVQYTETHLKGGIEKEL